MTALVRVDSENFFVSTERNANPSGMHTRYALHNLALNRRHRSSTNEFRVVKCKNLGLPRYWTKVNRYNNSFSIYNKTGGGVHDHYIGAIPPGDYATRADLILAFAQQLRLGIQTMYVASATVTEPVAADITIDPKTNRFSFTLAISGADKPASGLWTLTCPITLGESYDLLGGDRTYQTQNDDDDFTASFDITITASELTIKSRYAVKLFTQPYVYLHLNLQNNTLATDSYSSASRDNKQGSVVQSTILAKAAVQTDWIVFEAESDEYSATIHNQILYLELRICDHLGRTFPYTDIGSRTYVYSAGGAPFANGLEDTNQAITGNAYFETTLGLELWQRTEHHPSYFPDDTIAYTTPAISAGHNPWHTRPKRTRQGGEITAGP